MDSNILQLMISTATVILSVLVSIYVTKSQIKKDFQKFKIEVYQRYAKSLFDKRVELYPRLWRILSELGKKIQYNNQKAEDLKAFKENIDKWNNKYSIFFTKETGNLSYSFRNYIKQINYKNSDFNVSEEEWKKINKYRIAMENALRKEIGVFDFKPEQTSEELFLEDSKGK